MYLKSLRLQNFKCFADVELTLGKITLLLGANSTGKTSLLNGILAALQSDQFPLALSPNGALVNLGDFRAFVTGHKRDSRVSMSLAFGEHRLGNVLFEGTFDRSLRNGMPQVATAALKDSAFEVTISRDERYRAEWKYNADNDTQRRDILESEGLRDLFQALGRIVLATQRAHAKGKSPSNLETQIDTLAAPPASGKFTFGRPGEFFRRLAQPRYILLGSHLTTLQQTLEEFRKTFNYVGSFRQEPQRSYYQSSRGDLKVQRDGENYIEQILDWQDQKAPQLSRLIRALRSLRLISNIRARRLPGGLVEVSVRPHKSQLRVSLADIGFGIGQLLPILVADVQLTKGATLAMSQPEIHLHPSVQADLADYFVQRTTTVSNRYIIETHSEYLLNRLRALIAKGELAPEDLSIVYLTNDGAYTTAHKVEFTASGEIIGAPKEFFQTYMMDVMDIALNAQSA